MKKIQKKLMFASLIIASVIAANGIKVDALGNVSINYKSHVSNIGWMSSVSDGDISGTTGRALPMEAINISSPSDDFKIEYKAHVRSIGDMPVTNEGNNAGTTGRALPIEAISVSLKDSKENEASGYIVKYRAHVEDIGWMPWVSNGQWAGTKGQAKSIEAIQIYIERVNNGVEVVEYAKKFLGIPYVWGGTTPNGFDCSGYVQYVYKNFGINVPRTTYDQVNAGSAVAQSDLKPGDIVFTSADHVGIYVGDNQIIHSPKAGDVVKISTIWSFYKARRIL
ncbi:NlpC/P60 family protein [Alloiococcus sp. CFN-8]|uniref:NlpC/P60 family protein n=1 Tax=Alloiococcus sp. CFN-8 TaxID=3416081 RepID=UPI003CF44589